MAKIVRTDNASSDLKDIFEYISKDSKRYAANQIRKIKNKTHLLRRHPKSGRVVPEIGKKTIRELIEGNYRIVYKISQENLIEIITVQFV